ncbi:hypothetical protein EV207_11526 [Scopulibacillus darangshiensis]|uniref:Uncharacterized protein n=1 Tax=Scopulibacillus darangshiensis TaxID=442528 RepID=A0A4R2P294_9BACL|nr:hypothetical protein [Scopulibacillus darangshiensis]TCP28800.1 hypothetical protein EV207_11526 [Scopulibacillus darangshiensis]
MKNVTEVISISYMNREKENFVVGEYFNYDVIFKNKLVQDDAEMGRILPVSYEEYEVCEDILNNENAFENFNTDISYDIKAHKMYSSLENVDIEGHKEEEGVFTVVVD